VYDAEFTYDHLDDMDVFDKVGLTCPEDTLHVAIYRPRTPVYTPPGNTVGVVGPNTFANPGANFAGAGVVPGDFIEVGDPTGPVENAGIHRIAGVAATSVDARILRDAADFQVNGDQVTLPVGVDLTVLGVRPGDLFHVLDVGAIPSGDVAVILEVTAPNVFTLTRNLGGPISVTGRIVREDIG
jgi:hypothetical protein